uniref:Uncharacterized protein n=1 Tax=Romanomermis culicivorax TaxID=13658 RepID=A0A915LA66_ROMCU
MITIGTLAQQDPWFKAATQVFYSLNTATGGIITIGSYMHFYNNCKTDAILISVTDTLTSILSGCAIFAILGYMANDLKVEVPQVTKS